jgi:hypothetical protein
MLLSASRRLMNPSAELSEMAFDALGSAMRN